MRSTLPEYEHSRIGDPVLLVQVGPLLDVSTPGQDVTLPSMDRAKAALLATHREPAKLGIVILESKGND